MHLTFIHTALVALALQGAATYAADDKTKPKPQPPCTAHSTTSGSFYDLNSISLKPLENGKKPSKKDRTESWHARGYDYGSNFTLNICAPVLEEVKDVVGIESGLWKNVSAYYESGGKTYSIGYADVGGIQRTRLSSLTLYTIGNSHRNLYSGVES